MNTDKFRINVVTLFPEWFEGPLGISLIGRAVREGVLDINLVDPRSHIVNSRDVDDYPFGGGPGMVLAPGPIFEAVEAIEGVNQGPIVCLTPSGRLFGEDIAREYAAAPCITLICGRYEGIDERVCEHLATDELSIGDYVLSGGEVAALVVIDAVTRLRPGVLRNRESIMTESHSAGSDGLLEYPQYTRPFEFRSWKVPDILRSGDHGAIQRWRRKASLRRTALRRPELLLRARLDPGERAWLESEGLWPREQQGTNGD